MCLQPRGSACHEGQLDESCRDARVGVPTIGGPATTVPKSIVRRRDPFQSDLVVTTVEWVFGAAAVVVLILGAVLYRLARRDDDRQTAAIVSFIVGADLLVLAVNAALV